MAHERKCFCCGAEYKYCGQGCAGEDPRETWRFLFDSENCRDVYEIWQSVRGNEISRSDAAKVFKSMNIKKIVAADTMVSKDIKQILKENEEDKHYNKAEEQKVEVKEEPKSEVEEAKTKVTTKGARSTKK